MKISRQIVNGIVSGTLGAVVFIFCNASLTASVSADNYTNTEFILITYIIPLPIGIAVCAASYAWFLYLQKKGDDN